jgi:hypothetical protein
MILNLLAKRLLLILFPDRIQCEELLRVPGVSKSDRPRSQQRVLQDSKGTLESRM